MKNPYDVLGLAESSSPDRLRNRYEELKAIYSEQRFEDGERGNEGARLLSELESSWVQIEQDIKTRKTRTAFGGDYREIEELIKQGNFETAQQYMDSVSDRDAHWHYYQSIIFYKREWLSESRAQLAIALQKDPGNAKYAESLRKIDLIMGNASTSAENLGVNQQGAYNGGGGQPMPDDTGHRDPDNTCANCLLAYCLTEICCTMARFCH